MKAKLFNSTALIIGYYGETYTNSKNQPYPHKGVDFAPKLSDWTVFNPMEGGECVHIDHAHPNYGKMVMIHSRKHRTTLRFCHLDSIAVNVGDKIKQNQKIGVMGATGNAPNGAHVHLEEIPQKDFGNYDFNTPLQGNSDPLSLLYYLGCDMEEYKW